MNIGIRLHDVNTNCTASQRTLEARAAMARSQGFSCVHLALQKVIEGFECDEKSMTPALAMHMKRVFAANDMDIAVLGSYYNLAHPDPAALEEIRHRYYANIRAASLSGACMVGTETGCPNAAYAYDRNTHTEEALLAFEKGLEPVVECAEHYGVILAIEPVWTHIVCDAERARRVLSDLRSENLKIIFDAVNLLGKENYENRDHVILHAADLLCDEISEMHLKDFVPEENGLRAVPCGHGIMDYRPLMKFAKENKPFMQATLEETRNENAVEARELIERVYAEV